MTVDLRVCPDCERGREACRWCENITHRDWEAICDCGLYDFGVHLLKCEERAAFKYVIPSDYATAEIPRDVSAPGVACAHTPAPEDA